MPLPSTNLSVLSVKQFIENNGLKDTQGTGSTIVVPSTNISLLALENYLYSNNNASTVNGANPRTMGEMRNFVGNKQVDFTWRVQYNTTTNTFTFTVSGGYFYSATLSFDNYNTNGYKSVSNCAVTISNSTNWISGTTYYLESRGGGAADGHYRGTFFYNGITGTFNLSYLSGANNQFTSSPSSHFIYQTDPAGRTNGSFNIAWTMDNIYNSNSYTTFNTTHIPTYAWTGNVNVQLSVFIGGLVQDTNSSVNFTRSSNYDSGTMNESKMTTV